MIEQRAYALERQLDAERSSGGEAPGGGRGQITVQFFEKRRRKAWLSRGDEEVCWECWTIKVTVAEPRTESGAYFHSLQSSLSEIVHPRLRERHMLIFVSLTCCRANKGPARYGTDTPHHRHEDRHFCQHPQRSHPPHHNPGGQSFSLQD